MSKKHKSGHPKPELGKSSETGTSPNSLNLKLCIASPSDRYAKQVHQVTRKIQQIYFEDGEFSKPVNIEIKRNQQKINKTNLDIAKIDKHFYDKADMAILVATGSQRLLLISKIEESQLGAAYEEAKNEGLTDDNIFLVLVAHSGSESLPGDQLYSPSLENIFNNQPSVGKLNELKQFISVGYTFNPEELKFNDRQTEALVDWTRKNIEARL